MRGAARGAHERSLWLGFRGWLGFGRGALLRNGVPLHNTKKKLCSGVAPQTPVPLYFTGQQRCFSIPGIGLFELHNARKDSLGSGVAPQTPIPLYLIGQQRCFWIPGMGVFELHNAKKYCLGSRVPLYPIGQQRCFWIPGTGLFELYSTIFFWFWGWRSKHPFHCTP